MSPCYACRVLVLGALQADVAFLAGITFAFQYNNEAMFKRLCPEHQDELVKRSELTKPSVKPWDRRK